MTSRLEKKCFLGSASLHGLLLVVLFLGTAFFRSKAPEAIGPVVTFDAIPTDKPFNPGGNPNGNPEPPAPAPQPLAPQPPPKTDPEPPKSEPVRQEEPKEKEPVKKETPKLEPKRELAKEIVKDKGPLPVAREKDKKPTTRKETASAKPLDLKVVKHTNDTALAAIQRAQVEKARENRRYQQELARYNDQRQRVANSVNGIVGDIGSSISRNTVVEPLGTGGAAYANYGSLVGNIYKRAVYASQPQSDENADAVIRIVVARDGAVQSSQWVRRTASPVLNKAVDRAMNSVRSLPQFPPESKDAERSFNITIAFEAKRVSG